MQEFQQLLHTHNEVKDAFDTAEASSKKEKTLPCLIQVDQWEHETVQRVQQVATKARATIRTILIKHAAEVRGRIETLSANMQQQQKEGIYLETDIQEVKTQLDELRGAVSKMHDNIQVTTSDRIQWDVLISVNMWADVPATTADDCWESYEEQRHTVNHTKKQQRKLVRQTRALLVFQPEEPQSIRSISRPTRDESIKHF